MALIDTGLIVRYYCDEAANGQVPTELEDKSGVGSPFNLAIDYDTDKANFIEVSNNRGLEFVGNTPGDNAIASKAISGFSDKLRDNIHGTQTATLEVVFRLDDFNSSWGRVFGTIEDSGEGSLLFLLNGSSGDGALRVNENDVESWTLTADEKAIWHIVIDTTEGDSSDRVKVYKNGSEIASNVDSAISQDATISFQSDSSLVIGNRPGDYARQNDGIVFYAAIYDIAFTAQQASDNYNVLKVDDDALAGPTIEEGSKVIDLNIPKSLTADGRAADGTWNYELDPINKNLLTTINRTRIQIPQIIHEAHFYTGDPAAPVDHLVGHWKMDDNAASSTLVAEVGSNGALGSGVYTEDRTDPDAIRGSSLLLDPGAGDRMELHDAPGDLADTDKFTIIAKIKPNFAYDTEDYLAILQIGSADTDRLLLYFAGANFVIHDDIQDAGSETAVSADYTSNTEFQQWITIIISVDVANQRCMVSINGNITHVSLSNSSWTATPDEFQLGDANGVSNAAIYIDEVKLYDGCILPYGAHFKGNGVVDTAVAHKDILFHLDFEGANETERLTDKINSVAGTLGGAQSGVTSTESKMFGSRGFDNVDDQSHISYPVTAQNIINHEAGAIAFWLNVQVVGAADYVFGVRAASDSTNRINGFIQVDTGLYRLQGAYRAADTHVGVNGSGAYDMVINRWYWVVYSWIEQEFIRVHVNNILKDSSVLSVAWDGGTAYDNLRILGNETGSLEINAWIDGLFITNDPYTPQIWTALGAGPRHMPKRRLIRA